MEINAELEQQVDDLVDKAQEHKNYEQAITSINFKEGSALMKKILTGLTDDKELVAAALRSLG